MPNPAALQGGLPQARGLGDIRALTLGHGEEQGGRCGQSPVTQKSGYQEGMEADLLGLVSSNKGTGEKGMETLLVAFEQIDESLYA